MIDVSKPEAATEYLLSAVQQPELQQQLHADLDQAVQLISSTLQLDHVHAKLQLILQQSCPNWHADTVGMRMLATYAGPGTWYIANRCVRQLGAKGVKQLGGCSGVFEVGVSWTA